MDFPHKGAVMGKALPFHDVIMLVEPFKRRDTYLIPTTPEGAMAVGYQQVQRD